MQPCYHDSVMILIFLNKKMYYFMIKNNVTHFNRQYNSSFMVTAEVVVSILHVTLWSSHSMTPCWRSFGLNPGKFHTLECAYFSVRAHITCALTVGKFFVLWLGTLCSPLLWEVGRLICVCLLCACSTCGENMPCEFTVVPWTELNQRLDVS